MNRFPARSTAVVAALLVLSGCATQPVQSGATPQPTTPISEAPSQPATPSPAAEPAVASAGSPRVPLECPEVVPEAVLDGFHPELTEVPRVPPGSPQSAAVAQAGMLICLWRAGAPDEYGFVPDAIRLDVLVDAGFDVPDGEATVRPGFGTRFDTFAEDSAVECSGGAEGFGCEIDGVVGRSWFSARIDSSTPISTVETALDAAERFGGEVAAALRDTEPLEPFEPVPTGLPTDCAGIDVDEAVPAAFPEAELSGPATPGGDAYGRAAYRAWDQVGFLNCAWRAEAVGLLQLNVLPGGAWAWDPAAIERAAGTDLNAVTIDGADSAASWCTDFAGDLEQCTVMFSADGSFFAAMARHESDPSVALERAIRTANAWTSAYLD